MKTKLLTFLDYTMWVIFWACAVLFILHAAGCVIDKGASKKNEIQGYLETHLAGCVSGDHFCRCAWVENARLECIRAGLEQRCADDWTETNRGEPDCPDFGHAFDGEVHVIPMVHTENGAYPQGCDRAR